MYVLYLFQAQVKTVQPELWIFTHQLPKPAAMGLYSRLDATLESFGFAQKVREICAPAYNQSGAGHSGDWAGTSHCSANTCGAIWAASSAPRSKGTSPEK